MNASFVGIVYILFGSVATLTLVWIVKFVQKNKETHLELQKEMSELRTELNRYAIDVSCMARQLKKLKKIDMEAE